MGLNKGSPTSTLSIASRRLVAVSGRTGLTRGLVRIKSRAGRVRAPAYLSPMIPGDRPVPLFLHKVGNRVRLFPEGSNLLKSISVKPGLKT